MSKGTALVTGASMGIGLELARLFARDGFDLVLVARSESKLHDIAGELRNGSGIAVTVVAADLSDPRAPKAIAERLKASGIEVDHLVNNAGFGTIGAFADSNLEDQLAQIQVNVGALTALTRLFLPGMIARGCGRILNIASTAGFQPGPGMAVYYATKAYVISFSEAIAHELRGTGVTVTAHCPGATSTNFANTAGNGDTVLFKIFTVASAAEVARHAYDAMMAGRIVAIHGLLNRAGAFGVRISPRASVRAIAAWANSKG